MAAGTILAHEVGHTFRMDHDKGECSKTGPGGHIMTVGDHPGEETDWSTCSKEAFRRFFQNEGFKCMKPVN